MFKIIVDKLWRISMSEPKRRSKLQKRILICLYFANKPVETLQKIADEVNAYPSSVSRSIKLLKEEGLIEENSSGYQLTDKGKKNANKLLPTFVPLQPAVDFSILKMPEQFFAPLKNIQAVVEKWNTQMVALYQTMLQPMERLQKAYKKAMEPVREFVEVLNKQIPRYTQAVNQIFIHLKKQDEEEAAMLQEINKELIPYGWTFSPSFPTSSIREIYKQVKNKDAEEVIEIITKYFSNRVCEEIINSICSRPEFSTRSHLIKDAFQAHCEGKYTLSIPVFLAQAEGAFIDHFENKLYTTKKKRYLSKNNPFFKSINIMVESFDEFIRKVLAQSYDIKRKIPEGIFARHPILHGRSTDYGTKENSIRAILLLDYVKFIISLQPKAEN